MSTGLRGSTKVAKTPGCPELEGSQADAECQGREVWFRSADQSRPCCAGHGRQVRVPVVVVLSVGEYKRLMALDTVGATPGSGRTGVTRKRAGGR